VGRIRKKPVIAIFRYYPSISLEKLTEDHGLRMGVPPVAQGSKLGSPDHEAEMLM
jgi:hypothetical protein